MTNLKGNIEKIGTTHSIDVLLLHPLEKPDDLDKKILKRCKIDVKDHTNYIVEGDIVLLTTFF
jgi:hypothetical protein